MYNINKNRYANKYNPIVKESGEPKFIKKEAFYEQIKQKSAKETLCGTCRDYGGITGNPCRSFILATDCQSRRTDIQTKDSDAFYDFRDGSVVPTDTDGKSDITYGNLTIKVGTKNAFNYHGSYHGTLFKDGNSFEIKVNGHTKITLGGCQYSQSGSITASSADGSYTETKEAKTKDCYHNASNYTNEELKLLT